MADTHQETVKQLRYIGGKLHKLVRQEWRGYADSIHITWRWEPVNEEKGHFAEREDT